MYQMNQPPAVQQRGCVAGALAFCGRSLLIVLVGNATLAYITLTLTLAIATIATIRRLQSLCRLAKIPTTRVKNFAVQSSQTRSQPLRSRSR